MVKYFIFVFGVLVLTVIFLRPSSSLPKEDLEITITIPEGFTVEQMAGLFEEKGLFSKIEFIKIAQNEEGYLFPDTYRFFKSTTPEKVMEKMKKNFDEKISEFLPEIERQKKTPRDIIIMASIIEKEVHKIEDRGLVSGILWKRIKEGIGLQVDATITYVLKKTSAELTLDDLKTDSVYNTYKYKGLPKGPISNPGKSAIFTAVFPVNSKFLFYLSDKDGKTHYAKNFEEHKKNKLLYLH